MSQYLKGMDTVMVNLNREIAKIEGRSMKGLIESAMLIRNDMDKTPPLVPIDTGNLRHSWISTPLRVGSKFGLLIGFTANYATFVHEMRTQLPRVVKNGKVVQGWHRSNSGPKFFESALFRNKENILKIIQENARIK